ncbi:unnamed protein product [Ranitomeya imitator]|uniref:Retrotransposon gag domain-containing protein n=1 Tax=Ranitomeya imitator TaxID=111125 RepID=A0ABN9LWM0_9NEOB|nr:unnamed protein product [Ranitomeya imitator]
MTSQEIMEHTACQNHKVYRRQLQVDSCVEHSKPICHNPKGIFNHTTGPRQPCVFYSFSTFMDPLSVLAEQLQRLSLEVTKLHSEVQQQRQWLQTAVVGDSAGRLIQFEPKIALLDKFSGEACKLYFKLCPYSSGDEEQLVGIVISLLQGDPQSWAISLPHDSICLHDIERFFSVLALIYDDLDRISLAESRLCCLQQGNHSVETYSSELDRWATAIKWNYQALRSQFCQGLTEILKDALAVYETPESLEAAMSLAIWVDRRLRNRWEYQVEDPFLETGSRFIGAYKITTVNNSASFRFELPMALKIHNVFHGSLLKNMVTRLFMNSEQKVDLKINIIGPMGTGKTSLLNQYVHNWFRNDYRNTLGAHILTKTIQLENKTLKMQIWDTGGQERFRSLVSSFYKGSDGCLLVFDVTDEESFSNLETWRADFMDKIQTPVTNFPIIILGNKIDLEDRQVTLASGIKVSRELAASWCEERKVLYFEVSAKDNINVDLAFETLAKEALIHRQHIPQHFTF